MYVRIRLEIDIRAYAASDQFHDGSTVRDDHGTELKWGPVMP
jgi:hypothetical protein